MDFGGGGGGRGTILVVPTVRITWYFGVYIGGTPFRETAKHHPYTLNSPFSPTPTQKGLSWGIVHIWSGAFKELYAPGIQVAL